MRARSEGQRAHRTKNNAGRVYPSTSSASRSTTELGVCLSSDGADSLTSQDLLARARSHALACVSMATKMPGDEPRVQMATRVPASLLLRVKIHCVEREVSVMAFVEEALREKLRRAGIRRV